MKIIYHFGLNVDKDLKMAFLKFGIELEEGFQAFEIAEHDEKWPQIKTYLDELDYGSLVFTEFTKKEVQNAKYLAMGGDWHHGYPEPSDDFAYLEKTYDLSDYCPKCGIGKKQNHPFYIKGEPKWGRRKILALNWVFDEFFVQPEVAEEIFLPLGVKSREVLHIKTGRRLNTVVQLCIPELDISLDLENREYKKCRVCHQKKYLPLSRGYFPAISEHPKEHIFKTQDYIGGGGIEARKAVIVSQCLYSELVSKKIKGASYYPVKEGS